MPKRIGNLIHLIAEPDNLRIAVWKASRGKRKQAEVRQFFINLDQELMQLRYDLLGGSVSVGGYHQFRIYDPKERVICAAPFRQRVLHHAIMNCCHNRFEAYLPDHVFSSRKGRGTSAAFEYAVRNQERFTWFAKLDVRGYFASICHTTLLGQLSRLFKDISLLELFYRIMQSGSEQKGVGLPIGNLTSQYWANHYLACCDHFILQQLRPGAYCRYMDDMVLWHTDKAELIEMVSSIQKFCVEKLNLTLKPPLIQKSMRGLPFIGYTFFPKRIRISQRGKMRFRRKMKLLQSLYIAGEISQATFQMRCLSMLDFLKKADSYGFRSMVLRNLTPENG